MNSDYTSLSLDRAPEYLELLSRCNCRASDYSLANLWGWAPHYGLQWSFDGTLCRIRQQRPFPASWAPVGPWEAVDWSKAPDLASGAHFIRVPYALGEIWRAAAPGRVKIEDSRDQWDYLYLSSELCTLPGNRFHKKKNLLRQFMKNYEYCYNSMAEACVETVLNMQAEWCRWRDCESSEALLAENDAVARVLTAWNRIPGLCGGIIRIDDVPVAYTLAEPLCADTLLIHFEKAAPCIKGGYQAINYLFCNDAGKNFTYINREQDIGDEGLRQAKMSYNPADFSRKCSVRTL
ncbi:MAG: phosphatidylglycerol lysyltransferase domain-containing protein [Desulfovibrio sp.]|jgi:hypothetical protein|nr:phosphatidylglycerol lysyltransferase domain-containing protein [Desulfovibrio sp.]